MTQDYLDTTPASNVYGSTGFGSFVEPLADASFRILSERTVGGKRQVHWELRQDENRGPQAQVDSFEKGYAGWSSSTADPRFRGYIINPLKTTYTVMSLASGGAGYVYGADLGGVTVIATGSGANTMYKVTDMATGIPTAVTYNPGAAVTGMFSGPLGGVNRLFVGRQATTTDLHTVVGTSAATMHADFNSMWGGDLSPINASTPGVQNWLFYCGTTLKSQPISAATGDAAPTPYPLSNIPGGGVVYGFETLEKSPKANRFYMGWPRLSSTSRTDVYRLVDVNAEGTDPQETKLSLGRIKGGRFWNHVWVGHDDVRVVGFDGATETDFNAFTNVAADSDKGYTILGLGGSAATLRMCVLKSDYNSVSNVRIQWWEFMDKTKSWLPVSEDIVPYLVTAASSWGADGSIYDSGQTIGAPYATSMPYGLNSGFTYIHLQKTSDTAFAHQLSTPPGINPFNAYRKTGSSTNSSRAFSNSVHTFPVWLPPGKLGGHPFDIEEIDGRLLDIGAGGSDATIKIEVAVQTSAATALSFTNTPFSVTFSAAQGVTSRVYRPPSKQRLYRLQERMTLTQGTAETNKTPNGAYLITRGVSYVDE